MQYNDVLQENRRIGAVIVHYFIVMNFYYLFILTYMVDICNR